MNKVTNKLSELFQDEAFMNKAGEASDLQEMQELFHENGVDLSEEELTTLLQMVSQEAATGELSEDELIDVSGGGKLKDAWNAFKTGWDFYPKFKKAEAKFEEWLGSKLGK
ncbi:MAG: hypothetical protein ACI4P4_02260 [Faecousia sp.]